ncbi:LysR family transcriptional regulator [Bordetella bronchialis]|uniref:LysR family transcriptional regulator n=1 Tax=Bordetella bronchialis TaxID=463025 RepID=A0ABM6CU22_9BORD|nr:LysR family transcriptional regulator [Bordetella bronchialis]ANN67588.1 LysR family transcriptional regulator [Bordetella bronchialis]
MDKLHAMETFIRVVEAGSFKKAADTMHVLPSTVTRTIKELESHLGTRLLNRTTRALSLTDAGLRYYDSCKAILSDMQAAESMVVQSTGALRGAIRVGTTPSLAKNFLIPALPEFRERYPGIAVHFQLEDATVDIVQRGLDCVIRAGEPPVSRLVARPIGRFHWYVCASPQYLEKHGRPTTLAALKRHVAVGYVHSQSGRSHRWLFQQGGNVVTLPMPEQVSVDDTDTYVSAGVAGLGLIRVASYMARPHIEAGRLVRVLADIESPPEPVSILYPQSRHLAPAIRAFIDWCTEVIGKAASDW